MLIYLVCFKQYDGIHNIPNINHRNICFRDPLKRLVFIDLMQGDADTDAT